MKTTAVENLLFYLRLRKYWMRPLRKLWLIGLLLSAFISVAALPAAQTGPTVTPRPTRTPVVTATQVPVITSTPRPDGSVIHVVEPGQALWSIATTYKVSLADIYALNGMTERTVIFPGDKLLVVGGQIQPTLDITATISATMSATLVMHTPTPTQRPTRTLAPAGALQPSSSDLPASRATPTPALPAAPAARIDPLLAVIGVLVFLGSAFVLFGTVLKKG